MTVLFLLKQMLFKQLLHFPLKSRGVKITMYLYFHFYDTQEMHSSPWFCFRVSPISGLIQGQARGYGHITHFFPSPKEGHDFRKATVAQ